MSASITLQNISWSTPEGRSLFSDLTLSFDAERTALVGRNGVGKSTLLKLIAGDLQPLTGDISISGTTGAMRQVVQVNDGETLADLFAVSGAINVLRRAEAGDATLEELADADWTLEDRMRSALELVGLDATAETVLSCLSGGQRTRAGLAALVFSQPDFIILDEPTNNLDQDGRQAVIDFLAAWRGGALIVSHDRTLLETMDAIVEITSLGTKRYGGNWSHYRSAKALEHAAVEHDVAEAEKQLNDVARKAQARAEAKARKDGAGKQKAARGDQPRIVLGGMKSRSEGTGGSQARLTERRQAEANTALDSARRRLEILQPLSVSIASTGLPSTKLVLQMEAVTTGYQAETPILRDVSFAITGPERVAITGKNGSGKSTLLSLVTGGLKPSQGQVRVFTQWAMLDQRVSLMDGSKSILDNFRHLNPSCDDNECRAALARFMFRGDAALQVAGALSGGQLLRAGLACTLGGSTPPPFLLLDEPTNHLDLEAIETLEAGLSAYDGALLVVSHDEMFLEAIGINRYQPLPMMMPAANTSDPPSTT
ncbi:ABC-F family ATP-binding cassette domain-containing protein [Agrobacterium sp.]|uniref:ABC-F family ATP-binding cassette domain-containing protein n=1 Tax=Agrobacterium sp. TaxID=361 RepID=UPI0028B09B86|nr:ABC-F family ATP-binding cassette domain-containing protein [Agrobacterium sp.]